MAERTRGQKLVSAVVLVGTIMFAEVATERDWSILVLLLFLAGVWAILAVAYRENLGKITLVQWVAVVLWMVALAGGLWIFAQVTEGAWAIAFAFVYIVALWALTNLALRRRPR